MGNWQEKLPLLMGDSAPTMPNMAAGKAPWWKGMLTPAAQGGGLEKLAIGLDLFGQGMGGKPFGATQMAQSSLANVAEQKRQQGHKDMLMQIAKMMGQGPTPKGQAGINKMTSSMGDDGVRKLGVDLNFGNSADNRGLGGDYKSFP